MKFKTFNKIARVLFVFVVIWAVWLWKTNRDRVYDRELDRDKVTTPRKIEPYVPPVYVR